MNVIRAGWQLLPRKFRRALLFGSMALRAPRPAARPEPEGPVAVAGFLSAPTGLGEGARRMVAAMRRQGVQVEAVDLTTALRQGPQPQSLVRPSPGPGCLIVHVNAPMLPWALAALGAAAVRRKRIIAYWAWELPKVPEEWRRGFDFAHEVWVPSHYVATALGGNFLLPLRVVPHAFPVPDPAPLGRAAFGLPPGAFISLVMFDATSSVARKNPMGAIRAHRAAFGNSADHVLVVKAHSTRVAGKAWAEIVGAVAGAPNIRILEGVLPERERWALLAAVDVLLSLHRAEGYGLTIAEAMALGRSVVATGWSGSEEVMAGPGCHAVPSRLIPARDPQRTYDYPEMLWAEPDEAAAAAILRVLAEQRVAPPPLSLPSPDYAALLRCSPRFDATL